MNNYKKTAIVTLLVLLAPLLAHAQSLSQVQQKVADVMQMDHRTDAERARDADRDPVNAIDFMGLEDDMTVIEFIPASQAYYTKILGPVLVDKGHLMVVDTQGTFNRWGDWIERDDMAMVHQVPIDNPFSRTQGVYTPGEIDFGLPAGSADKFLQIREYHNFSVEDNARINAKVFETLKSGGEYVIIDHTRRHMEDENRALARREDPVDVIIQVQAAGFVLDRQSDMFFEKSDDLTKEVGEISNMTDRFFLVFRKP